MVGDPKSSSTTETGEEQITPATPYQPTPAQGDATPPQDDAASAQKQPDEAPTQPSPEGPADGPAQETAEHPAEPDPAEQIAELNDKLLRTLAELENTRRRGERDRIDAQQYGMVRFARDMLSVADNLGRALAALPEEHRADLPETVSALVDGVAATERELIATFERYQISAMTPIGEKFDPNFHEAMFEAPGTGQAAGTVIEVIEAGYRIGERLLRPARVGVAKADA